MCNMENQYKSFLTSLDLLLDLENMRRIFVEGGGGIDLTNDWVLIKVKFCAFIARFAILNCFLSSNAM